MRRREADEGLDFDALRHAIEHCDLVVMLGFYAEDAKLCIVNADAPHASPFELSGKAEIAKHLRAVFGQKTSHRVGREVFGKDRVTFQETCEYPDGGLVWVESTLEAHDGKIFRQVDVVTRHTPADHEGEIGQRPPTREIQGEAHPGVDATPPDILLRSEQATEKEDLR
jgi:hypothetical protein